MGGIGSGRRWHYGAKDTVEDYRPLDIRRWQQEKVFFEGNIFNWGWYRDDEKIGSIWVTVKGDHVILDYRHRTGNEDWQEKNYPVYLSWSDCHLGGKRPWFICPARGCGRRVAKLYGGGIFACRHCYQLAYPSQREVDHDRLARRADKIRAKLGWRLGILNAPGWKKPKGMHWKTFERLVAEHDRLVDASLQGIAFKLRLTGYSIEDWL